MLFVNKQLAINVIAISFNTSPMVKRIFSVTLTLVVSSVVLTCNFEKKAGSIVGHTGKHVNQTSITTPHH